MGADLPGGEVGEVSAGLTVERQLPPLGVWKRWVVVDRQRAGRRLLLSMAQQRQGVAEELDTEAMLRRARRARAVVHPALTRVTDCGEIPNGVWVVEELGDAEPLSESEAPELPDDAELMTELVHLIEGLGYAHQQGMVHGRVAAGTVLAGNGGLLLSGLALGGPWSREPETEDDVRGWAGLALQVLGPEGAAETLPRPLWELLKTAAAGSGWVPGDGRRMAERVHAALGAGPGDAAGGREPAAGTREVDVKRRSIWRRILSATGATLLGATTTVVTVALLTGAAAAGLMYALEGGPREVVVPNLLGVEYEEAAERLGEEGLRVGTLRRVYRDDVGPGKVAVMNPGPGMRVREGRDIALVVSRGSAEVTVPRVVGLQVSEAEKVLEKLELTLTKEGERRSNAPTGEVVSQSPAPGRMAGRGTEVSVVLSGGDEYGVVEVEDEEGETRTFLFRELHIVVPEGERIQRITVLEGQEGAMEAVYDRPHRPGDRVLVEVRGMQGKRIEVQIEGKTVYKTQL